MKIRSKYTLSFTFVIILSITTLLVLTNTVLLRPFKDLESKNIENHFRILEVILIQKLEEIEIKNGDWAHWNDTYKLFDDNPSEKFLSDYKVDNLKNIYLADLGVSNIIAFRGNGEIIFSEAIHTIDSSSVKPNKILEEKLIRLKEGSGYLALTSGDVYLYSTLQVTDSNLNYIRDGYLTFASKIDENFLKDISSLSRIDMKIGQQPHLNADKHVNLLSDRSESFFKLNSVGNSQTEKIYLYYTLPLNIIELGKKNLFYFLFMAICFSIIIWGICMICLDKYVLERILQLDKDVNESIKNLKNPNGVKEDFSDEITEVQKNINKLLSENHRINSKLEELIITDTLTGLYNRRHLENELKKIITRINTPIHKRQDERIAYLIMLDLDNFKSVNDNLGHDAGDILLKDFSNTLLRVIRDEDLAFRYGGDEFILLLRHTERTAALNVLDRIHLASSEIFNNYKNLNLGISSGLAEVNGSHSIDSLLKSADSEMYKNKWSRKTKLFKTTKEDFK